MEIDWTHGAALGAGLLTWAIPLFMGISRRMARMETKLDCHIDGHSDLKKRVENLEVAHWGQKKGSAAAH